MAGGGGGGVAPARSVLRGWGKGSWDEAGECGARVAEDDPDSNDAAERTLPRCCASAGRRRDSRLLAADSARHRRLPGIASASTGPARHAAGSGRGASPWPAWLRRAEVGESAPRAAVGLPVGLSLPRLAGGLGSAEDVHNGDQG